MAPLAPWPPHQYLSKLGGGGGWGVLHTRTGPGRPPGVDNMPEGKKDTVSGPVPWSYKYEHMAVQEYEEAVRQGAEGKRDRKRERDLDW